VQAEGVGGVRESGETSDARDLIGGSQSPVVCPHFIEKNDLRPEM